MLKAPVFLVFIFLAFLSISCTKPCDECADEFKLRFKFRNDDQENIYNDISGLQVTDMNNNPLTVEQEISDTDSIYVLSLNTADEEVSSDTIVFIYNNQSLDTGAVTFGYQRDNDCCNNPRIIEGLQMQTLNAVRLIKREFDVYSIIVPD